MYQPNAEFLMPDGIESMTADFFIEFCASFSYEVANENAATLQNLELNQNTPFCLLEMIKEFLIDGNENYGRYLRVITSYLNKFIATKREFRDYCNSSPEYKSQIVSSILYLLPFLANLFQETDEIIYFSHLYLGLISLVNEFDDEIFELFNGYIDELLNQDITPYQTIISMMFASKVSLCDQNNEKFNEIIKFLLTQLPESDLDNEIEKLTYKILFNEASSLLTKSIINMSIEIPLINQAIDQFNQNFIQRYYKNYNIAISINELDIIEDIFIYFSMTEYEFSQSMQIPGGVLEEFIKKIINSIYLRSNHLIISSRYTLSTLIGKLMLQYTKYLFIPLTKPSLTHLARLFYNLSVLSQKDIEGVFESEESFFYDYYDITFEVPDQFSNRQILSQFLNKVTELTQSNQFIMIIISLLNSVSIEKIDEAHFFLLSLAILVSSLHFSEDQDLIEKLYELSIRYYTYGSDYLISIAAQNLDIRNIIFMFTFYFFIRSIISFFNNEEEIGSINDEIYRLMEFIQGCADENPENNFNGILFTLYCIIINELLENDKLMIPVDQVLSFIYQFYEFCFTNDAIMLMEKLIKMIDGSDYPQFLHKIFLEYFNRCEQMICNYKETEKSRRKIDDDDDDENDENSEEEDFYESFLPFQDKELNYTIRFFNEAVTKMADIIKKVDYENFFDEEDLEKIRCFALFLMSKGEEWQFGDECIEFMSAVLCKTPDLFNWTQFYIETINRHERALYFGEWVVPLIYAVSYQPELMNQELFDLISETLSENIMSSIETINGGFQRKILATWDALMAMTLITRLFEFGICKDQLNIQISDELVKSFIELFDEIQPTEEDISKCDTRHQESDFYIKDQELGFNITKLAGLLAAPLMSADEICQFLSYLADDGQIVSNEMRYMIIILIDAFIAPNEENDFFELRQMCLTNSIQASGEFKKIYHSDKQYFVESVPHPIFKLHQIDGFVFETEDIEEEEEEEADE